MGIWRLLLSTLRRLLEALSSGLVAGARGAATGLFATNVPGKPAPGDRSRKSVRARCAPIDRPEYAQPDPRIYDQYYLESLGLAVSWNNPDIQLSRNGQLVSSEALEPGVTYDVTARIWNGSLTAPAINMPVRLVYRDFGVGTEPVAVDVTTVSVGVKGGPYHPAFATIPWTTPTAQGHYCLQVLLDPVDDANFKNNLGQENTNVGRAQSPANFEFTLRNDTERPRRYRFEVDAYSVAPIEPCGEAADSERARIARLAKHAKGQHPVPIGWSVDLDPSHPALDPNEAIAVKARVTPPPDFSGRQPINVNAYTDDGLAGGVTLLVVAGEGG